MRGATLWIVVGNLVLVAMVGAPPAAAVSFTDDFTAGASVSWGNERGSWSASGGVYSAGTLSNNPLTYTSLAFALTDFTLDVDINDVQDGGIWLRSSLTGGGLSGVLLVTGPSGGFYWHKVVNDADFTAYGQVTGLFTSGSSDIHLRVVVSGDDYNAFCTAGCTTNSSVTPATTLNTSAYTSGRVGLYDYSNQTFDNVALNAVPEPATLWLLAAGGAGMMAVRRRRPRGATTSSEPA